MSRSNRGRTVRALTLSLILATTANLAWASDREGEHCDGWFPDFHCSSKGRYAGFSRPMTMPYLFEHPFVTTDLQAAGIWQELPERSAFDGGYVDIVALQIRLAITDRLGFIATRDGFAWFKPDLSLVSHAKGFADMSFGFKYALIDRPDTGFILSSTLRFEPDFGDHDLFQGQGDGVVIPGLSMGWNIADGVHLLTALGAQLPFDGERNSSYIHYNLHLDYALTPRLAPFIEMSGITYTSDGDGSTTVELSGGAKLSLSAVQTALSTGRFEGGDFANLGSEGVRGNDVITGAVGLRYRATSDLSIGVAYERPVTSRKDLLKQRVSIMATYEF